MAKNPLWILETLGPVICEFTLKESRHESDIDWGRWLMSETRLESIFIRQLYPVTAFHSKYPDDMLIVLAENPYCAKFVSYALDTLPRNTPAYHALLEFMRYYGN